MTLNLKTQLSLQYQLVTTMNNPLYLMLMPELNTCTLLQHKYYLPLSVLLKLELLIVHQESYTKYS